MFSSETIVLSPPSKPTNMKKRVSPAKDIQHKRVKPGEQRNGSWKHRPDHLDVLGTSVGSGSGSLGTSGLHESYLATAGSPVHSLGILDVGIDGSLSIFGGDDLDGSSVMTTSTPQATPVKSGAAKRSSPNGGRAGGVYAHSQTAAAAAAGKKVSLDWSDDEIRLFEEGVVLYGVGNWRQVAALVGTRNTAQVKTFSIKFYALYGAHYVPHVDPARLEELRSQYLPNSQSLNKSQRLKRSSTAAATAMSSSNNILSAGTMSTAPASPMAGQSAMADKKLMATPKKTSSTIASNPGSGHASPSGYATPSSIVPTTPHHAGSNINSKLLSPGNKGPHNRPAKGPAASSTPGRRKADEQLILLKKTGDEDEDICIEDEEIDIDGDDDRALLNSALSIADGEDGETYSPEDDGEDQVVPDPQSPYSMHGSSDNLVRQSSGSNSASMSRNQTPQWRKRPDSIALDDSNSEYMTEDSLGPYSEDSSVAGDSSLLSESSNSIGASNAFSVAQALKALGLEGEPWIQDVEIPPSRVLELQEDQVLDLEMQANSEFFEGNNVKTPERYVRIRNHILRTWLMNKQRYVTKTSVRRGLRDCGDVNAIGRVHQFLELVGAINFGLEAPPSCRKQGQPEPLSVLMMNKSALQQHLQQMSPSPSKPRTNLLSVSMSSIPPPTYASVAAGTHLGYPPTYMGQPQHSLSVSSSAAFSKPSSIRCQFDPSFEVVKNPAIVLPFLEVSSNAILVMDLHAHLHRRDGFGLIAGVWNAEQNKVTLRHAIPYTGPQSSPASSMQAVSAWERTVTQWLDSSSVAKQAASEGTPLEILGYYTTHKLMGALSVTQFTHYRNQYCKGPARNRPFIGLFAVPFERTADSTQFISVMYPTGANPGGMPQKTLYSLKRNVLCEKKMPQEQIAQLFSAYAENDVAVRLNDRDDRELHRTLLDRCFVSLSSAVFVSERDKNAMWEHMRVLASEGVNSKLLSMLNTKEAVWSFREPPASLASEMPGMFSSGLFDPAQKLDFGSLAGPHVDSLSGLVSPSPFDMQLKDDISRF